MNYVLDLAGALLYFAFSIIISPLIILLYALIFLVTAFRYMKAYSAAVRKEGQRRRARQVVEPLENVETIPSYSGLVLQKLHVFGVKRSA